jgi:hypothetical protein
VDHDTVYTGKDVSDDSLIGESDLRKYVHLPKDLCIALTHETDGSVFSSTQWTQSPGSLQKKFTDVFARTVALKAKPTACQQCECVADQSGNGVAMCSSCNQRNPIFSLLPNFNDDDYSDEAIDNRNNVGNDDDDDSDDDEDERQTRLNRLRINNRNLEKPSRPINRGNRVDRPTRPRQERPERPERMRPQRIPSRPEIRDQ